MLNSVQLIGSLGADPEQRQAKSGSLVVNLRVATTERVKKGDEWADHTEWHTVTVFGKVAELVVKYTKKGSRVFVAGKLRTSKWTDKNGVERFTTSILSEDIKFLSPNSKKEKSHEYESDEVPF